MIDLSQETNSNLDHADTVIPNVSGHYARMLQLMAVIVGLFVIAGVASFLITLGHHNTVLINNSQYAVAQREVTVEITPTGFVPQELSVMPGTVVVWSNDTDATQSVGSNPYPTHTSLPGLVSGSLAQHQSYSFVFNKTGTWEYQDDQNPLLNGSIVVQ